MHRVFLALCIFVLIIQALSKSRLKLCRVGACSRRLASSCFYKLSVLLVENFMEGSFVILMSVNTFRRHQGTALHRQSALPQPGCIILLTVLILIFPFAFYIYYYSACFFFILFQLIKPYKSLKRKAIKQTTTDM